MEEGEGDEGFQSETPTSLQMKWKPVLEGEEGRGKKEEGREGRRRSREREEGRGGRREKEEQGEGRRRGEKEGGGAGRGKKEEGGEGRKRSRERGGRGAWRSRKISNCTLSCSFLSFRRCQRLEQRYILLACKYEALAKRHKELERHQQKQSVLKQMERTVSQVRWGRGRRGGRRGGGEEGRRGRGRRGKGMKEGGGGKREEGRRERGRRGGGGN